MKKIIHFIRHGQTKYNFEKKIQGSIDIPLSNIGIQQTKNFEDRYFLKLKSFLKQYLHAHC